MRLQTLETLLKAESVITTNNSGGVVAPARRSIPRRVLKAWMRTIGTLTELCRTCGSNYGNVVEEILCCIKQTVADDLHLPTNPTELVLLPVEQFTHLEIPVADFQETDMFQIHRARCTETKTFRNSGPRNNWVWILAGGEDSYGDLRGRGVVCLVGLFKIRNIVSEAGGVRRQALLCVINLINAGRFHLASGHLQVGKRYANSGYRDSDWTGTYNSQLGEAMDSKSQD